MFGEDFDELFRELYIPAYSVALRILGDPQDAEDAASEAMARAAASWRRVQGVEYQRAWVLRVTANVSIDVIRRRRTIATDAVEGPSALGAPLTCDDRLVLAAALAKLPRRQREVLVLRYLADMTETNVAEHLRISQGAVKQHTRRGLVALRRVLDGPSEGVSFAF
jgi:RNA polymerase sigma factor (sigma-70 family)